MSTVLITGVNGFIGSHLATHLAHRGHRVVGSTSSEIGLRVATPGVAHKVVLRLGEPCDPRIVRDVDAVIHGAWDSRPGAMHANLEGTRALLDIAQRAGVAHQLFLSSYSAHSHAVSAYGRAKLAVQDDCLGRGFAVASPGLVVGAGGLFQRMSNMVARRPVVPLIDGGRTTVPIVAVTDLQRALTEITERRLTGLFNLFNPEVTTLRTLMHEIRTVTCRRTLFLPVPARLLLGTLWLTDTLGIPMPVNVDNVRGLLANVHARHRSDLHAFVSRPMTLREMVHASHLHRAALS